MNKDPKSCYRCCPSPSCDDHSHGHDHCGHKENDHKYKKAFYDCQAELDEALDFIKSIYDQTDKFLADYECDEVSDDSDSHESSDDKPVCRYERSYDHCYNAYTSSSSHSCDTSCCNYKYYWGRH